MAKIHEVATGRRGVDQHRLLRAERQAAGVARHAPPHREGRARARVPPERRRPDARRQPHPHLRPHRAVPRRHARADAHGVRARHLDRRSRATTTTSCCSPTSRRPRACAASRRAASPTASSCSTSPPTTPGSSWRGTSRSRRVFIGIPNDHDGLDLRRPRLRGGRRAGGRPPRRAGTRRSGCSARRRPRTRCRTSRRACARAFEAGVARTRLDGALPHERDERTTVADARRAAAELLDAGVTGLVLHCNEEAHAAVLAEIAARGLLDPRGRLRRLGRRDVRHDRRSPRRSTSIPLVPQASADLAVEHGHALPRRGSAVARRRASSRPIVHRPRVASHPPATPPSPRRR